MTPWRATERHLHHVVPDETYSPKRSEVLLERSDYKVRLAGDHGQRSKVSLLVNRMYSWRGYRCQGSDSSAVPRANQITLEASSGADLFATVTVALDSRQGLAADDLYAAEIGQYRSETRRVCEFTRLAADPRYSSKAVLASLFHLAHIYARHIHGATDGFIEVNPRHVAFYRRMLGFRVAGAEKICPRVQAPAVLMRLDLDHVDRQVRAVGGGRADMEERSLYPYFFSEMEQAGLTRRIRMCVEGGKGRAPWTSPLP
jgi:hypothetical protein